MKNKYKVVLSVFAFLFVFSMVNVSRASAISMDDVFSELKSLKTQIVNLKSQLGARAVATEESQPHPCINRLTGEWVMGTPIPPNSVCAEVGGEVGGGGAGGSILLERSSQSGPSSSYVDIKPIINNIAAGDVAQVVKLQQILKDSGQYNGKVDGILGTITQKGITNYYKTQNADGIVSNVVKPTVSTVIVKPADVDAYLKNFDVLTAYFAKDINNRAKFRAEAIALAPTSAPSGGSNNRAQEEGSWVLVQSGTLCTAGNPSVVQNWTSSNGNTVCVNSNGRGNRYEWTISQSQL